MGPCSFARNQAVGVTQPFQVPYHMLLRPLSDSPDGAQRMRSSGYISMEKVDNGPARLFVAAADNFRMGGLFMIPDLAWVPPEEEPGAFVMRAQGNFTSNVANVRNVAEGNIDYNADQSSGAGEMAATLDYPSTGINPMQMWRVHGPDQATIANIGQSRMLDTHAGRIVKVYPHDMGTTADELSLRFLLSRKSLLATINWNATDPAGALLFSDLMIPNPLIYGATLGGAAAISPTLLGYVTNAFGYWKGGLKLTLQFVLSKYHTGRVVVCTHYGGTAAAVNLLDAMSQYANVIDATADLVCHEVVLPWRAAQQMLSVYAPNLAMPVADFSMGEYSIRVVNPLRAPDSVAQSVSINLYISAADDFQVDFARQCPDGIDVIPTFS